jgi:hypothetical protein
MGNLLLLPTGAIATPTQATAISLSRAAPRLAQVLLQLRRLSVLIVCVLL